MRESGPTAPRPDKRSVRDAFDRAAAGYDRAAAVQREACAQLAQFGRPHRPAGTVARVLDAGCGTGHALALLGEQFPAAAQLALDFAPAMLTRLVAASEDPSLRAAGRQGGQDGPHLGGHERVAEHAAAPRQAVSSDDEGIRSCAAPGPAHHANRAPLHPVCADLEALPLADASVDFVWSSLALQWCDPDRAFAEFARVMRPGARAWLATLGPGTLHELREAFTAVDDAEHVIGFHTAGQWLTSAARAGLAVRAHDTRTIHALAGDLRGLLADIKAIGAHSVGPARRRTPLGKAAWRTLQAAYERHRRPDALLPASYELVLIALARPE